MRTKLRKFYEDMRASYWFIPLVLSVGAAILAVLLIAVDTRMAWSGRIDMPFLVATQPEGARAVLSAIGGSMIGVAGTVFSVTMAAVVYASGSYGPRLLTNFMNDRGNQFTLGVFTATFVYCILVLRTVRTATADDARLIVEGFVPILATFGATILGLCCIGVLIYFIHHVPTNIHVSNVIAGIGRALRAGIDERFPVRIGQPASGPDAHPRRALDCPPAFAEGAEGGDLAEISADDTGYIQLVDEDELLAIARRHDIVLRIDVRPGAFLHPGRTVFEIFPADRASDEVRDALRGTLALGTKRTSTHDLLFLFDELVEIAARALSPGVNDPYTAVNCIDWMGAAMGDLAQRRRPDPLRADEDGALRIITLPLGFDEYLEHSFGHLRQYAAADMIAACHVLTTLAKIAGCCGDAAHLDALRRMGAELVELSRGALAGASLQAVEAARRDLEATLAHPRRQLRRGSA